MVSHRFKCPETYRGKIPLLQHYRGVRRGRQCWVVCCIKGCNTLHKHTHQSVEDSAHTNTLYRPHMEVGPPLTLGTSCIVSAEINGFSWSCHCFLSLFTQHPSLPVTLTLTPQSHIIPHTHHNKYEGALKDGPCGTKKAQDDDAKLAGHHQHAPHQKLSPGDGRCGDKKAQDDDAKPAGHHQHAPHQKLSPGDGPCGAKKAQDDRPTKSHAL